MAKAKAVRAWAVPVNGKINPLLLGDTRARALLFSDAYAMDMRYRNKGKPYIVGRPVRVLITEEIRPATRRRKGGAKK